MRQQIVIMAALTLFVSLAGCGKKHDNSPVLAKVDGKALTRRDFYEEAKNVPLRRVLNVGAVIKRYRDPRDILDLMIELEVLVDEARRKGLSDTERFKFWRKAELDRQTLWELYYQQVDSSVNVTEDELRTEYLRSNQQLRVRHLFAKTKDSINEIRESLIRGNSFEQVASRIFKDPQLASNGGSLGWISWGDMDPYFEEAAWELSPGGVSEPVQSEFGWHVIKLDERKQNVFLTEDEFNLKRESLRQDVHKRKARKFADKYVNEFMRSKNPVIDRDSFLLLAGYIGKAMAERGRRIPGEASGFLDPELAEVESELEESLDDVLVRWEGGGMTIGDFMKDLSKKSARRRGIKGAASLRRNILYQARDRLLTAEAYRLGLHKAARVKKEVAFWEQNWLMNKLITAELDTESVTEEMILADYDRFREKYSTELLVNVREIYVKDLRLADSLRALLDAGAEFAELATKHTLRMWAAENGGELGFFERGKFKPIDDHAFRASAGELVGPFPVGGGYSIIRIIGKKGSEPIPVDEVRDQIRRDILLKKRSEIYPSVAARLKRARDVQINEEVFSREVVEHPEWAELGGAIKDLFIMPRQ